MAEQIKVPAGFELFVEISPSGRSRRKLRVTDEINWLDVMGDLSPEYLAKYAEKVVQFLTAQAGGTKTTWPVYTGASKRSFDVGATKKFSPANKQYNRSSQPTDGAALIFSDSPYAKAVEKGAYYQTGPVFGKTPWRRPSVKAILRLERKIRKGALKGSDINEALARGVLTALGKELKRAKQPR